MKSGTEAETSSSAGLQLRAMRRDSAASGRQHGLADQQSGGRAESDREQFRNRMRKKPGPENRPRGVARENPCERAERDSIVQNEDDGRDADQNAGSERKESDSSVVNKQAGRKDRLESERERLCGRGISRDPRENSPAARDHRRDTSPTGSRHKCWPDFARRWWRRSAHRAAGQSPPDPAAMRLRRASPGSARNRSARLAPRAAAAQPEDAYRREHTAR